MASNKSVGPVFSVKGSRRGFTVFLMFVVLLLILSSELFSQSVEILALGRMQVRLLNKQGEIRPRIDNRIRALFLEKQR